MSAGRRLATLAVAAGLVIAAVAVSPGSVAATTSSGKLRGGLAQLVSGERQLDSRIPGLVAGYRPGELPYFAVLTEPNDAVHRAQITALGARVLREYRSVDAFALASDAATVSSIAALPWVEWLTPVEVVVALDHQSEQSQTRGKTADVGAPPLWDAGFTGEGVRIAVLDTGHDPSHLDLNDQDFRHWEGLNPLKLVESRNFVGGVCGPPGSGSTDGHGHGTHVAGIATGTGEGVPGEPSDNGRYVGIAPGAELAVGKVLADVGAGLNSDLIGAMEWAAMPEDLLNCAIGADIVNLSLGSESRPTRLNSGSDVDTVSFFLNHLAVQYGTLFVAALGNSGPYIGSGLEAPGSAAQALSVAAAAKDYDVNHDNTLSGDTCAGWFHQPPPATTYPLAQPCGDPGTNQPPSLASLSSRGPSGDLWLRPDLVAPGYNIVSAQAAMGTAIAANDLNINTRTDPLYATASGTSMAAPATAGSAALLLQAYRAAHGASPSGPSGLTGFNAPSYALLRAALMNTAGSGLHEARWILTTDPNDPFFGSLILMEVRNRAADPYVGPLAEGAGKLNLGRAVAALRGGVVAYSTASGSGAGRGTGPRDLQGTWQVGAVAAGASQSQRFVLRAAPGAGPFNLTFSFQPGNPSDGSRAIPGAWARLPGTTQVSRGRSTIVRFSLTVPSGAAPGSYTGSVVVQVSNGQTLRIPVFASVALHDPNRAAGNAPGPQARVTSAHDVFAKGNTTWPFLIVAGGAAADWLVYPVNLASDLSEARFSVYDSDDPPGAPAPNDTYDLYVYDSNLDYLDSTHPFLAPGVTDTDTNDARGPSTQASPQVLSLSAPEGGRYYLVVNRAKPNGAAVGDFGSFVLTLDEIGGGGGGGSDCDEDEGERVDLATSAPTTAAPGSNVEYTITYHNHGDDEDDCEIDDDLDDDMAFVSASGNGAYDPATHAVTWALGPVAAGESGTVRVTAQVSPFALPGTVLFNEASFGLGSLIRVSALAETLVLP